MKKVSKGIRLYGTRKARSIAIGHFLRLGYNYFTGFWDVDKNHFGLSFGKADWATERGFPYRKDC